MKKIILLIFVVLVTLFLVNIYDTMTQVNDTGAHAQQTAPDEPPKKTYLDTPANNINTRVEALNISNTMHNPVDNYMNTRIDARGSAKNAVNTRLNKMEEQNRAMEAITK